MHWVGLVRNVMLGREGLTQDVLLDVVGDAGGLDGRSHLTTGNVTFHADRQELDSVVERLENGIEQILGRREICAVRQVTWLQGLVAQDRFQHFGREWETEVAFLRHDAPVIDRNRIGDPRRTVLVAVLRREVLTARPRSGGGRPHVNRLLEQASQSPATARGWSTLQRIVQSLPPSA